MGRPSSYVAFLRQLAFTAGITAHGAMEMMVFSKAISHHATRCAETNDQAELKRTIHTWKSLTHGFIEDSSSMIEGLIAKVVLHGPARNFRDATAKLDMPDLAVHFAEQAQRHQEERDRRKRADSHQSADLIIHHASIMAGLSLPMIDAQVQDPPKMTASDFHPSRLAEHAYYQGIAMRIICLLLLIIAGTLGIRMACLPAEAKALSKTAVMELAPKDWLLLLAIGGLAPALLYFTLQYASPLNTRAWGPKLIGIHQFFAMHAAMLILSLSLSAALISWLNDRKLGLWFPPTRFPKIRWVIVFCALAGLLSFSSLNLLIHQASASVPAKFALLMGFVFCPLPILWLIIRLILPWMGKGNAISRLATSLRMQFPVLAVAFLLCALSVPLLQWEERHWMQQDHLLVATPEKPAMTAHEWDITQILRKELRETLAQIPE